MTRQRLWFSQLREQSDLTMIVVEQNRDFIAGLAHRVVVMHKGTIIREASATAFHDEVLPEIARMQWSNMHLAVAPGTASGYRQY